MGERSQVMIQERVPGCGLKGAFLWKDLLTEIFVTEPLRPRVPTKHVISPRPEGSGIPHSLQPQSYVKEGDELVRYRLRNEIDKIARGHHRITKEDRSREAWTQLCHCPLFMCPHHALITEVLGRQPLR